MSSILAKNLIYLVDFTLLYIYCESIVIQANYLNTYNSLVVELDNFSMTNLLYLIVLYFGLDAACSWEIYKW